MCVCVCVGVTGNEEIQMTFLKDVAFQWLLCQAAGVMKLAGLVSIYCTCKRVRYQA